MFIFGRDSLHFWNIRWRGPRKHTYFRAAIPSLSQLLAGGGREKVFIFGWGPHHFSIICRRGPRKLTIFGLGAHFSITRVYFRAGISSFLEYSLAWAAKTYLFPRGDPITFWITCGWRPRKSVYFRVGIPSFHVFFLSPVRTIVIIKATPEFLLEDTVQPRSLAARRRQIVPPRLLELHPFQRPPSNLHRPYPIYCISRCDRYVLPLVIASQADGVCN